MIKICVALRYCRWHQMVVWWEGIVSFSELTSLWMLIVKVVWATWLRQFDLVQLNCYLGAKVDTKVTKARTDDLDQLNWYLRARRAVHLQLLAIAGGALQRQEWKLTMKWTWQIMCSSSSEEILRKASGHSVDRKGNLRNWKFSQRRNSHGAPQNSSCQLLADS